MSGDLGIFQVFFRLRGASENVRFLSAFRGHSAGVAQNGQLERGTSWNVVKRGMLRKAKVGALAELVQKCKAKVLTLSGRTWYTYE